MQAVDVLGDERIEDAAPLQGDERAVPGVGLPVVNGHLQPAAPRALAHLGIGDVVLDRGHLLGLRVLRPHALGAAKIRNAGVGRDAGAGEDDDTPRGVDPAANGGEGRLQVVSHDALIPRPRRRGYMPRAFMASLAFASDSGCLPALCSASASSASCRAL